MAYCPSASYVGQFTTVNPTTGAAQNADSTPTAKLTRNGTDDLTVTFTVTNLDTGRYKLTATIPATYNAGDVVQISVAATVATVAGKAVVESFILTLGDPADEVQWVGTCAAGSTTTQVVLDSTASGTTGQYVGRVLRLRATGGGQSAGIVAYNGGTKTASLYPALLAAPANGDPAAVLYADANLVSIAGQQVAPVSPPTQIQVVSPVAADGSVTVIRGDDYKAADGRALVWTDTGGLWKPDLTSATITVTVQNSGGSLVKTGSVLVPSGATGKQVQVELAGSDTSPLALGDYRVNVVATLSNGHVATLVQAVLHLRPSATN